LVADMCLRDIYDIIGSPTSPQQVTDPVKADAVRMLTRDIRFCMYDLPREQAEEIVQAMLRASDAVQVGTESLQLPGSLSLEGLRQNIRGRAASTAKQNAIEI
jgi:hypothetical protein